MLIVLTEVSLSTALKTKLFQNQCPEAVCFLHRTSPRQPAVQRCRHHAQQRIAAAHAGCRRSVFPKSSALSAVTVQTSRSSVPHRRLKLQAAHRAERAAGCTTPNGQRGFRTPRRHTRHGAPSSQRGLRLSPVPPPTFRGLRHAPRPPRREARIPAPRRAASLTRSLSPALGPPGWTKGLGTTGGEKDCCRGSGSARCAMPATPPRRRPGRCLRMSRGRGGATAVPRADRRCPARRAAHNQPLAPREPLGSRTVPRAS